MVVAAFAPKDASGEQVQHIRQAAWRPLEPVTSGAFVNYLSDASEASVVAAYPSATYARLASIKASYDPDNVFNHNQNIKPACPTGGMRVIDARVEAEGIRKRVFR